MLYYFLSDLPLVSVCAFELKVGQFEWPPFPLGARPERQALPPVFGERERFTLLSLYTFLHSILNSLDRLLQREMEGMEKE